MSQEGDSQSNGRVVQKTGNQGLKSPYNSPIWVVSKKKAASGKQK